MQFSTIGSLSSFCVNSLPRRSFTRPALLILLALSSSVIAAAQCSPNGNSNTVTICTPAPNASVSNPVTISAAANTYVSVQKFLLYVDSNLVYQDTSGSKSISTTLSNLTTGTHYLVAQYYNGAWVKASEYFTVTSGSGCTSKSGPPSITICAPVANSTVTSPVALRAVANSTSTITSFLAYIDSKLVYQTSGTTINTSISGVSAGQHYLVLQFYNGTWFKQPEYFTVGSGGGITVTVSPSSVVLHPDGTQQFTASVQGTSNKAVSWSVDGVNGGNSSTGTISSSGYYTAPGATGSHTVKATSQADPTKYGTAAVSVATAGSEAVLTYHNSQDRQGANTNERILNPSNVNSASFGKKHAYSVDGQIYGQPLYMPNLTVNGSTHNVVFAVTENDSVYAFDANGGGQLWYKHLGTAVSNNDTEGIAPILGITSTPVIDSTTGTMYVLSDTNEGGRVFRLHALDLSTGNEKLGGPVVVDGSVAGTGWDSSNGRITLEKGCYQRMGLALSNGNVYVLFGHCSHGWILSYNKGTLQQNAIFNSTPNGAGGAFWGGGGSPAIDSQGNLFLISGVDINDPASGYNDAAMKLSPGLSLDDYFKPSDEAWLRQNDADFGSGAGIIMPDNSSSHPHEFIGAGKDGRIFVLDRDNMGGYQTSDHVIQEVQTGTQQFDNIFSTPAYWNGYIYYHCEQDVIKAFSWNNGLLSTSYTSKGTHTVGVHGATVSISANGNVDGIAWEIESTGQPNGQPAILRAYDALNVNHELYDSTQAGGGRDTAGPAVKFVVPTVADGQVFVGTANQLDIYGLF